MELLEKLKGKKTYIIGAVMGVLNLLVAFNLISIEQIESINYVLVALGLGALRGGVKK